MTRITGGAVPSQADLEAVDRVRELQATELARVRERAGKWRDGLVGLTALFGAVVFLRGGAAVNSLVSWARWMIGVSVVIALVTVIVASVLSMIAAFGWMSSPLLVGPGVGLHERLLREDRRQVRSAERKLKLAGILMVLGISAIAVAAGVSLFAPGPNAGTCIRVKASNGAVASVSLTDKQNLKVDSASVEVGAC